MCIAVDLHMWNAREPTDCLSYAVYLSSQRCSRIVCLDAHRPAPPLLSSRSWSSSDHTLYRHQPRCQHVSARIQPVPGHRPWNCPRNIQNRHGHHCKHGDKCSTRTNDTERYVQRGGGTDGGHAAEAGGRGASGFCQYITSVITNNSLVLIIASLVIAHAKSELTFPKNYIWIHIRKNVMNWAVLHYDQSILFP